MAESERSFNRPRRALRSAASQDAATPTPAAAAATSSLSQSQELPPSGRPRRFRSALNVDTEGDSGAETPGGLMTSRTPGANPQRRQALRNFRQRARDSDNDEGGGIETVRRRRGNSSGDQSPMRISQRLGGTRQSLNAMGEDEENDNEELDSESEAKDKSMENAYDEPERPLIAVRHPSQDYPLQWMPHGRDEESIIQQLLAIPQSHPDVSISTLFRRAVLNPIMSCFGYQSDPQFIRSWLDSIDETDILRGRIELAEIVDGVTKLALGQRLKGEELELLLQTVGNGLQTGATNAAAASGESELQPLTSLEDGIYRTNAGMLAPAYMHHEGALSGSTNSRSTTVQLSNHIELSRVTQRILRDLQTAIEDQRLRNMWQQMRESKNPDINLQNLPINSHPSPRVLSSLQLLKQLPIGPVLRVLEDPVNDELVQPYDNPEPSLAYGGVIGNWSDDASTTDRLGNYLPGGTRKHAQRSILRLHLHQCALMEHPLFNDETRNHIELKRNYIQYRTLFEQRSVSYLMNRTRAVLHDLVQQVHLLDQARENRLQQQQQLQNRRGAVRGPAGSSGESKASYDEYDEDDGDVEEFGDVDMLKKLLVHFYESLEALAEVRSLLDNLSEKLYGIWGNIKDIRARQGFSSTRALLVARLVQFDQDRDRERDRERGGNRSRSGSPDRPRNSNESPNAGQRNRDHNHSTKEIDPQVVADANGWTELKHLLEELPATLRSAKRLIEEEEGEAAAEQQPQTQPSTSGSNEQKTNEISGRTHAPKRAGTQLLNSIAEHISALAIKQPIANRRSTLSLFTPAALETLVFSMEQILSRDSPYPTVILRVSDEGHFTPDAEIQVPYELERRRKLQRMRVRCVIKVNNVALTQTNALPIASLQNLVVSVKQQFEFRVFHAPSSVSVDLYTNYGSSNSSSTKLTSTYLSTVAVPITAHSHQTLNHTPTHSFAPLVGWFAFSSANEFLADDSWYRRLRGTANPFMARIQGALLCATEFDVSGMSSGGANTAAVLDGVRCEDLALLPPALPPMHQIKTASSSSASLSSSSSASSKSLSTAFFMERDFQALLPDVSLLDPNDPRNDRLLYTKLKGSMKLATRDVFQLSGFDFVFAYSEGGVYYDNFARMELSQRLNLLRMRTRRPYLFSSPIPLSDEDIRASDVFKQMLATDNAEVEKVMISNQPNLRAGFTVGGLGSILEADLLANTTSNNKAKISNFLERIRNSKTALNRSVASKSLTTTSVVIERDFTSDESTLIDLIPERKRALHPKPKTRTPVAIQVGHCDLLVQIIGARNIPLREERDITGGEIGGVGAGGGGGGSGGVAGLRSPSGRSVRLPQQQSQGSGQDDVAVSSAILDKEKYRERRRARTFVEVRFQEHVEATTCTEGPAPLWKQSLSLPFRAPQNDYSPASLALVGDSVIFTLFDEYIEDDAGRPGRLEGESTERVERRYLGSFSIPFTTIYKEGRVEGLFRLETPVVNMGYNYVRVGSRTDGSVRMFADAQIAEDTAAAARGENVGGSGADPNVVGGDESWMNRLVGCLTLNWLRASKRRALADDGWNSQGNLIHPETGMEFSYFAAGHTTTFIKVMATLDPLLVTPPEVESGVSYATTVLNDRPFVSYSKAWIHSLRSLGTYMADRGIKTFANDSSALFVFIPRFLTPMRPPPGLESSRRGCVHFVSLIPFMDDGQSFVGDLDLWCTSNQFLEIGAGDEEEHATLLYNYLYYIQLNSGGIVADSGVTTVTRPRANSATSMTVGNGGYPSEQYISEEGLFLVIGRAIPEGDTVYILMRDKRKTKAFHGSRHDPECFLLINPCNGAIYSAADRCCPLKQVYNLVTPYNTWANIQAQVHPGDMVYNVMDSQHWIPFFGQRCLYPKHGLPTVQTPIEYSETSMAYAVEIEAAIKNGIKTSLRRWRSKRLRSATTFHPDACQTMTEILPILEEWKSRGELSDPAGAADLSASNSARMSGRARSNSASGGTALRSQPSAGLQTQDIMDILQDEVDSRMRVILRTRRLHGCPLNIPFTDVESIMSKVKTLCVHEAQHPEVQFVMAVRAFPLYNNMVSLWIFLGTLESYIE